MVDIQKPESVGAFIDQLKKISDNKNLYLLNEEISNDIEAQEKFVKDQNEQIEHAEASLISFTDCLSVLEVAKTMLPQL